MTVKNNVVPVANRHDVYIWLAPCRELIDARERVIDAAKDPQSADVVTLLGRVPWLRFRPCLL